VAVNLSWCGGATRDMDWISACDPHHLNRRLNATLAGCHRQLPGDSRTDFPSSNKRVCGGPRRSG